MSGTFAFKAFGQEIQPVPVPGALIRNRMEIATPAARVRNDGVRGCVMASPKELRHGEPEGRGNLLTLRPN